MDLPFFNYWCCSGTLPFDYQCIEGDKTYYSQDLDTIAIDNEKGTCIFVISDGFWSGFYIYRNVIEEFGFSEISWDEFYQNKQKLIEKYSVGIEIVKINH